MNSTVKMPAEERKALEKLTNEQGERRAAEMLEVSPVTLVRALAGRGVQRTTAAALRAKLLELPKALATG
jgi:hypothetical protein